jgi:hypothetical protein
MTSLTTFAVAFLALGYVQSSPPSSTSSQKAVDTKQVDAELKKLREERQIQAARKADWEKCLRDIAKREGVQIAWDVNLDSQPPFGYDTKEGKRGLEAVGVVCERRYEVSNGFHVYVRTLDNTRVAFRDFRENALDFFGSLSPDLQKRLMGDGLPVHMLPPDKLAFFGYLMNVGSGQFPGSAVKDFGDTVLRIQPRIQLTSQGRRLLIEPEPESEDEAIARNERIPKSDLRQKYVTPELSSEPKEPYLDFKEGMLLTLQEVVIRAQAKFEQYFMYDGRMRDSLIFLNGKMGREQFDAVLTALTKSQPVRPRVTDRRNESGYADIIRRVLLDNLDLDRFGTLGVSKKDILDGKSLTLSEILGSNPNLMGYEQSQLQVRGQAGVRFSPIVERFGKFSPRPGEPEKHMFRGGVPFGLTDNRGG